jgi:putative RecB family exonuclease
MARRTPALSPSRAGDFRQCPLMFRLRVVDQIPEPPSAAATLGTLVHSVLEDLFDLPASERTVEAATARLEPTWSAMRAKAPELKALHDSPAREGAWLAEAGTRIATYFTLENPGRLEPAAREEFVEWQLPDGPLLRGVIDRVDVAPDGSIRVVDYKTGKSPAPQYGSQAKFQMRFYALLVERLRGRRPSVLQLLYLKDGASVVLHPTEQDLDQIEHEVRSLWNDIVTAATTSTWRTRRSALCGWCSFQALCPEFGGTPPALDPAEVEAALGVTPRA